MAAFVMLDCAAPEPAQGVVGPGVHPDPRAATDDSEGAEQVGNVVDPPSRPASRPEPPQARTEPFPNRASVTVDELMGTLESMADEIASSPAVQADYEAFVQNHGLLDSPELLRDYARVKLAFEATRDGGWWHLRWTITNEQPNSEQIWNQWNGLTTIEQGATSPSAWAECDELSALFAFVARKLGVAGLGLFWPTWNHVVAVWTVPPERTRTGAPVRIVVPTSQVFLTTEDSLGTDGFNPWKQKTIYEYRRRDVDGDHRIDVALARFFVQQIAEHGRASQDDLQVARNLRAARLSP